MTCPSCQAVQPDTARFCSNCGTSLATPCPRCGASAPPGAKFCASCGLPIGTAAPSPVTEPLSRPIVGERRVVTMVFCDVAGSTALAERLDPEDWTEVMNGAFAQLIKPVQTYAGTPARLMGDAILAFFGAPTAHEDDPRRAVLAALDMLAGIQDYRGQVRRRYGFDFDVRVGINTGLVVVGEVGADGRMEYTAMGDAVNVAARMEQTAQPGTVQVAAATYRQVASLFEVEPLGPIEVKGKSEPVEAYRVLGVRAGAVPARGIQGLWSPLVGREGEMRQLEGALSDLAGGRGQVVSVMGEAGLGKSRLLAELRQSPRATAAGMRWCDGRSFSYETALPYTPFKGILRSLLGVDTSAGYDELRRAVEALLPGRASDIAPFVASALDVPIDGDDAALVSFLDPPQLRGGVFGAVATLVEHATARQPLVLTFEDLHWCDPTSLDLLDKLMPLTARARLLLLAVFRPHQDEPSWRFHHTAQRDHAERYTPLQLERLDDAQARKLVANLLEIEDLPERVRSLILQKAEGNPFYVEEVIRALLDTGLVVREGDHWRATREIEQLSVPDTLAGVITTRLDRLGEEPKRVAQTAAVIGRQFTVPLLADVLGASADLEPALRELQRRELIRPVGGQVFRFKHGLTQETAYGSLLLSRRRELHGRAAEALKRQAPDAVGEIAQHYVQARAEASALPYLVAAGDRAARAYASAEAIGWYRQAANALEVHDAPTQARRIFEGMGKAQELTNDADGAAASYRRLYDYAQTHQDTVAAASAMNKLSGVTAMLYMQFAQAEQHLDEAEPLVRASHDTGVLVEHATMRCMTCMVAGRFDEAVQYLGESVDVARERGLREELSLSLAHYADTLTYMARFEDAWTAAQECYQVAYGIGDLVRVADVQTFTMPWYFISRGDFRAACDMLHEGIALAERIGARQQQCAGEMVMAEISLAQGEFEAAIEQYGSALAIANELGPVGMLFGPTMLAGMGLAQLSISPARYARTQAQHLDPLLAVEQMAGAAAWAHMGFAALALGNAARANELFQQGLTAPTPMRLLARPGLLAGAALAALERGDVDAAAQHARAARDFTQEHHMQHMVPLAAYAEGRLAAARGQRDIARTAFDESEREAQRMGLRPILALLRETAPRA